MYHNYEKGWIEVICGCMFAGKTEELIRRIQTLSYTKAKILVFKPKIDNRYDYDKVVSHSGNKICSISIERSSEIWEHFNDDYSIVAIDEVQFLDQGIIEVCERLAQKGCRVIVAGLDLDFRGEPFSVMPELLARAEFVLKLTAICVVCSSNATRTQRLVDQQPAKYDDPVVMVGAQETYEARCRKHHEVIGKETY